MNSTRNRVVGEYLRELQRSMGDLPTGRRDEILSEIEEHIAEGLAELDSPSDADVRNLLERVGDPQDIAAEARDRVGIGPPARRTPWLEVIALVFLAIPLLGWVIGIVLVWVSGLWTTREKTLATVAVPGVGFLLSFILSIGAGPDTIGPLEAFVLWTPILAGVPTAIYLGIRLRRRLDVLTADTELRSIRPSRRNKTGLIVGLFILVIGGGLALFLAAGSSGDERSLITREQFALIDLGDHRDDVAENLGHGESGSRVSGLDPSAIEQASDPGRTQYDDCWSYAVEGGVEGAGSEASVCFIADEVVYTSLIAE
jgi:uncharacterized membrane protein